MKMLTKEDLWSLEEYSEKRTGFREEVLTHKKNRYVQLGKHVLLVFEDAMTIRYQIQEMLRIEKVFEASGIQEELDAYNPLIPDGDNWKCSMLIQYPDVEERKQRLTELVDIENRIWVKVDGGQKIFAIADEDLERSNDDKTSAVHFLRFQLTEAVASSVKSGASLEFGTDHRAYDMSLLVNSGVRDSLAADIT